MLASFLLLTTSREGGHNQSLQLPQWHTQHCTGPPPIKQAPQHLNAHAIILLTPLPTSATVVWCHITPAVTSYQTPCYSSFEWVLTPPITTHDPCQLQHMTYWPPFPKSGNSNWTIPSVMVYVMVICILQVYSHNALLIVNALLPLQTRWVNHHDMNQSFCTRTVSLPSLQAIGWQSCNLDKHQHG